MSERLTSHSPNLSSSISPACNSSSCQLDMIPIKSPVETSEHNVDSGSPSSNDYNLEKMHFYSTYNVWTGINIAASLGGFFMILVMLLFYKSKCKRTNKYPPCPSAEEEEMLQMQPWSGYINRPVDASFEGIHSGQSSRHSSHKSSVCSVRDEDQQLCRPNRVRASARSAPGSVMRLPRRATLSSNESSVEAGDTRVDLFVHHPGNERRRQPRFAKSFDERHSDRDERLHMVDINVIQPTPSVTPSPSRSQVSESAPDAAIQDMPRIDLPERVSKSSAFSLLPDATDADVGSIVSESLLLADDDWTSRSESPRRLSSSQRRRSTFSRQASVCLDDDMLPETVGAETRTELLYAPGLPEKCLRAAQPEGGNVASSSTNFLTVPGVHTVRSPSTPRRSPYFLAPPPLTFGPGRPASPPPSASFERTYIDLSSPDRPLPPFRSNLKPSSVRTTPLPSPTKRRAPRLSQMRSSSAVLPDRHWTSIESVNRTGSLTLKKNKNKLTSSFDAPRGGTRYSGVASGSSPSLRMHYYALSTYGAKSRHGSLRHKAAAAPSHMARNIPSIEIFAPPNDSPPEEYCGP